MKISVVVPAYNVARFIRRALDSVIAQTCTPSEIIVVDDGSSDDTAAISSSFPGVTVLSRENCERGAARNTGIREASSDFVALLDGDDEWLPGHLENAADTMRGRDVDVTFGAYEIVDANGCVIRRRLPRGPEYFRSGENVFRRIDSGGLNASNVVARRTALLETPFSEDRAMSGSEDWHCWARLSGRYSVLPHRQLTCRYFLHGGNTVLHHERMTQSMQRAVADLSSTPRFAPYRQEALARFEVMAAGQLRLAGRSRDALTKLIKTSKLRPSILAEIQWWRTALRCALDAITPSGR